SGLAAFDLEFHPEIPPVGAQPVFHFGYVYAPQIGGDAIVIGRLNNMQQRQFSIESPGERFCISNGPAAMTAKIRWEENALDLKHARLHREICTEEAANPASKIEMIARLRCYMSVKGRNIERLRAASRRDPRRQNALWRQFACTTIGQKGHYHV